MAKQLVVVAVLAVASYALSTPSPGDRYVPVPCPLSLLRIVDWGKCHVDGDAWDCPAAHLEFRTDCFAKKVTGKVEIQLRVDRPTLVRATPQ